MTGENQFDGVSVALSSDVSSAGSFDQLRMPELSCANHASGGAATKNEASLMVDGHWQMTSDKQPECSPSLLLQSSCYDPHIAFTTRLLSPVATTNPLPYFAAIPPAVYRFNCNPRQTESVNSRPVSDSSHTYTMPVPSDAVLVRPRMQLVAGKQAGHQEATTVQPVNAASLLLLSSAVHDVGCTAAYQTAVDGGSHEVTSSAATVYGGGFYAPPAHSTSASHTDDVAAASFSCCPHCGMGFAAAAVPRNIIYHPTGPSYVIHGFTPTIQPCYSATVSSVIARPPLPSAAASYAASTPPVLQSSVRLPDSFYQQTSTRPPVAAHSPTASPVINAPPSMNAVRVRTTRPPPSCANCGRIGHTQLDCKEPTIDTVLNTRA